MKNLSFIWTLALVGMCYSSFCTESSLGEDASKPVEKKKSVNTKKKNTAVIETEIGKISIQLFPEKAPKTVENFVGLATGKKPWTDPKTGKEVKGKPLYNGTIFHRVIPKFMIQGGDPNGDGSGGPGYEFENENPEGVFDTAGTVAMANAGVNTNGSQFFITVASTPHLKGDTYTVFGKVTNGLKVVEKIVSVPRNEMDRPDKPVKIKRIVVGK